MCLIIIHYHGGSKLFVGLQMSNFFFFFFFYRSILSFKLNLLFSLFMILQDVIRKMENEFGWLIVKDPFKKGTYQVVARCDTFSG